METKPEALTIKQVAQMLQVSEGTVRNLIASGRLRSVQLGGPGSSIRIPRREVERLLEEDE